MPSVHIMWGEWEYSLAATWPKRHDTRIRDYVPVKFQGNVFITTQSKSVVPKRVFSIHVLVIYNIVFSSANNFVPQDNLIEFVVTCLVLSSQKDKELFYVPIEKRFNISLNMIDMKEVITWTLIRSRPRSFLDGLYVVKSSATCTATCPTPSSAGIVLSMKAVDKKIPTTKTDIVEPKRALSALMRANIECISFCQVSENLICALNTQRKLIGWW